jgi:LysM repeat protein
VRYNNDVKYIVANDRDNIASIAERYDATENQILRYNDFAFAQNQLLEKGTKVYLQPKRSSFHGKQKYHVLKAGEDLLFVSQEFGVKLSALKKRNGIEGNQVPATGQKVMLKGKSKVPLKTIDPYEAPDEQKPEIIENNTTVVSTKAEPPKTTTTTKQTTIQKPVATSKPSPAQKPVTNTTSSTASNQVKKSSPQVKSAITPADAAHVVAKGDTLFSIAQNFGLSVDELKKMNNLAVDTIFIGQKLTIK